MVEYCSLIFSKAFRLVDCGSFRRLIKYCRPSISDNDLPHCNTFRTDILRRTRVAEEKVREKLKNLPCKVSLTFEAWTSKPGDPYLSITGHYIDAPADCPNDWVLKTEQLSFEEIKGRHTGKNMAEILSCTVDRYQIHGKVSHFNHSNLHSSFNFPRQVGWLTSDGASVNRTTIHEFAKLLTEADGDWSAEEHGML